MKLNKFASSFCNLVSKHNYSGQFSHSFKNTFFSKKRLQNFSLSLCFFNNRNDNYQNTLIEKIKTSQSLSKKFNQLSKVEEKDIEIVEDLKRGNIFYPFKGPGDRFKKTLSEDIKIGYRKLVKTFTGLTLGKLEHDYFLRYTDFLIIGGGAVGLSIAYAMKNKFPFGPKIFVVDKADSFPHSSTNLGQGIVTLQLFTHEEEIDILKYGAEFFSSFSRNTEVDEMPLFKLPYDPIGSLVLVDKSNVEEMLKKIDIMKKYEISTKILDINTLKQKFPWLIVDDVLFGSLGMSNEGIIDPWTYLVGLKCKCINLGVHFVTAEVIDFGFENDIIRRVICKLPDGTYNSIDFSYCIIAGGLESLNLVNILNKAQQFNLRLKLPLEERMRYEYCFYNPKGPGMNTPQVIDSDGVYFRREGLTGHYVAGVPSVVSNEDENELYQVFQSKVKPFLMKRMPQISEVDVVKAWIDVYDFCISNEVGITGPHPEAYNIHFAIGFSHLGLQYLPALGRAIMEYIFYDDYITINFEMYHIENLWRRQHLEADRKRKELLEEQQHVSLSEQSKYNNN